MKSYAKSNPRKVKKISLRLPKIRGFAIDTITLVNDEDEIRQQDLVNQTTELNPPTPLKFSHACTSVSPNIFKEVNQSTPSSKIIWNYISTITQKDSSPKSEPFKFCVKGSNFSMRNLSKDINNLREKRTPIKKDPSINCSSCNITKSLTRNLSSKSASSKPETSEGSRKIKKRIWKIRGSLVK